MRNRVSQSALDTVVRVEEWQDRKQHHHIREQTEYSLREPTVTFVVQSNLSKHATVVQ